MQILLILFYLTFVLYAQSNYGNIDKEGTNIEYEYSREVPADETL